MTLLIVLIILVLVIVIYSVATYNNFVRLNEMVENSMAQIATGLQARWDNLNNLIDMTKDYSEFEVEALDKITKNRTDINRTSDAKEVESENREFEKALSSFYAVAENYPNLKTSDLYKETMATMTKHEETLRHLRMVYNDTVTKLNRKIKSFPANILANIFSVHTKDYFENSSEASSVPKFK
ncbi:MULTISPECIES: LemA family protein [Anaerococcus]|uniref:LemA family protein n=1 Tax=Anaerococcus TaxID=165779 RepID=UPI0027B986E0|nr:MULTISPECIES: LemA family protein [Anaerococcus]MDU2558664.1 LemA family protein [Anaerococcus prevotii]